VGSRVAGITDHVVTSGTGVCAEGAEGDVVSCKNVDGDELLVLASEGWELDAPGSSSSERHYIEVHRYSFKRAKFQSKNIFLMSVLGRLGVSKLTTDKICCS
jgi:hypothetical protein